MPTLRDVADACGVSPSTVSIALRNDPRVADKTRQRVQAKAKEMDYHSDPVLSALSSRRWIKQGRKAAQTSLAFLAFGRDQNVTEKTSTAWHFHRWAEQAAREIGYPMLLIGPRENQKGRWQERLRRLGVRGLILGPLALKNELPEPSQLADFCVVQCGVGTTRRSGIAGCEQDVFNAIMQVYEQSRARGYKRPGAAIYRHDVDFLDDQWRFGAVHTAQEDAHLYGEYNIPPHRGLPKDRDAFFQWLHQHQPDVIISLHGLTHWWLIDAGYRIPEDIGYIQLNKLINRDADDISGLWAPRRHIARTAVNLLDQMIRQDIRGIQTDAPLQLIRPTWNEGTTVRPRLGPKLDT